MQDILANESILSITEKMQGNPKGMYQAFLFAEGHEYLRMMREAPQLINNVDAGTGALIAWYPDRAKKKELFDMYKEEAEKPGQTKIQASIYVISEMVSCLNDVMEWTEKSYGGF